MSEVEGNNCLGVYRVPISRTEGVFPSSAGTGDIFYRVWHSAKAPRAAIQIVHGMAEYGERYEDFARALNNAGYDVWVMDLPGHGRSTQSDDDLGYFGKELGRKKVVTDIRKLTGLMRDTYPDSLPIILFGHSMGSLLARSYCERYSGDLAGAVFCGTSPPNPAAAAGIMMAKLVSFARGAHYRSTLIDNIAFGTYNKRIPKPRTKFDWLNTDAAEVDKYLADDWCGFLFTAQGFLDLFSLLKSVSNKQWFTSMPYQFPILLIAGAEDPVGGYGKGVELVARRLREAGGNRTQCIIYEDMRHEILNEPARLQVYGAVIEWLGKTLSAE